MNPAQARFCNNAGGDGAAARPAPPPWRVGRALACLPDGAGAQSVALALERGRSRAAAFLLLKAGHGVKAQYQQSCHEPPHGGMRRATGGARSGRRPELLTTVQNRGRIGAVSA